MKFNSKSHLIKIALLVFMVTFLLLRLNGINAPFERDEGEYAYGAWLMSQGNVPYNDSFLQKPPMILYTYFLALLINPNAVWPVRIIALVFEFITIVLAGLIVKKETNNGFAAIGSMYLLNVMLVFPYLSYFASNTEKFMIMPLVALLLIFVYKKDEFKGGMPFLFGVLSVISLLYKPLGIFVIAYIFFLWCKSISKNERGFYPIFQFATLAIIGGFSTLCGALAFFLVHGALPNIIEQVIIFNQSYAINNTAPVLIFNEFAIFIYFWLLVFLVIILGAINFRLKYGQYLIIMAICALTLISAKFIHYFYLIIPFTAILVTLYLYQFSLKTHLKNILNPNKLLFLICFLLCISLEISFIPYRFLSSDRLSYAIYGPLNNFVYARNIGERIKLLTQPTDSLYIAGSEPEINFYAKRKSTTKFDISYPFMLETPYKAKYQAEVINELSAHPPKVIVVSNLRGSWADFIDPNDTYSVFLGSFIHQKYSFVESYPSLSPTSGRSLPFLSEQLKNSSYIIYRLKR